MIYHLNNRKKLFQGIVLGVILCVVYIVVRKMLSGFLLNDTAFNAAKLILQFAIYLVGYRGMKKLYDIDLKFTAKGLAKGIFRYGAILFFVIIANFIGTSSTPEVSITVAIPNLLFIFVNMLGIGLAEEMIFRGVFFNTFRTHFGYTKSGILKALLISSVLFGSIHLVNLVSYPNLIVSTIAQVIYATFYGFLMGIVYYRSGNIWSTVILHCLVDFSNGFWLGFRPEGMGTSINAGRQDVSILEGAMLVLAMLPLLIAALVQWNKEFKMK